LTIHQRAIVIDGHSDILMPIADGRLRLREVTAIPDPAAWQPPPGLAPAPASLAGLSPHSLYFGAAGHYSLPQWRAGGVTAQVCAIFVSDEQLPYALTRALRMALWLHREVEENEDLELITRAGDLARVKAAGHVGVILGMEGLEPLGSEPELLEVFYKLGLRMAGLSHSRRNAFADGMQAGARTGGLTAAGLGLVRRMNELGIVIDLAHLNQAGFWDVLEHTAQPVVLSHSSARSYFPAEGEHPTRYPAEDITRGRERLRALAQNGGVFGVIFYHQSLAAILADIEFLVEQAGPDHVGLGTDFYGFGDAPPEIPDVARLPVLTDELSRRGYSDEVILKILGGNYLRVFEQVWKE
jgi:membrane dipeptidase